MSKMEKNGMEKLAKVLDSRMGEHSGGGFSFDFGVIKKDYSLVSNTFPLPIPKKDYSVCRLLANLSTNVSGGTHGGHNSGTGSHSHKVVMPKLKPGDRVLIVWVERNKYPSLQFSANSIVNHNRSKRFHRFYDGWKERKHSPFIKRVCRYR